MNQNRDIVFKDQLIKYCVDLLIMFVSSFLKIFYKIERDSNLPVKYEK
jgi:hypothetical protein